MFVDETRITAPNRIFFFILNFVDYVFWQYVKYYILRKIIGLVILITNDLLIYGQVIYIIFIQPLSNNLVHTHKHKVIVHMSSSHTVVYCYET